MNKWVKILLGGAALIGIVYIGQKGSRLQSLASKFILDVGTPRVHNVSKGYVNIVLDNINLTNQSEFSTSISNLFITIQLLNNGVWENLFIQRDSIPAFQLPVYGTSKLPSIQLSMPITGAASLLRLFNAGAPLKIVTRFVTNGVEIPIETEVDIRTYLQPIINLIKNPLNIFNS